jgi:y4mF family transcriptional regulator
MKYLDAFVKDKRKEAGLTQEEFAEKAGVALTVIRKIEQGKSDLQLEKVNQVLKMFGHILSPVSIKSLSIKDDAKSENLL